MELPPAKRIKLSSETKESRSNHGPSCSNFKVLPISNFDLDSSDFSKIVKTTGFIDKSLLIKCLFEDTCKVLITAPRRFGKSTNIDMVKRFLEIDVDCDGRPKTTATTANYMLFSENKLNIFKHEQFCKQHLGKHPVLMVDYKPLGEVGDFESMLSRYKLILMKTFEHHRYLQGVSHLWSANLNLEKFQCYIDPEKNSKLNVVDIKIGFNFLAEVLHKHFGKPVFLLLDEYDAYFNSFMFKENSDMTRIINFIQSTTADLLKSNKHIDHALLTGVLRLSNEGLPLTFSQSLNGIIHYKFLHKHPFCSYFGVTSKELRKLLKIFTKDKKSKEKCKITIDKYFNGYEVINKNIKIYSVWSILKFFKENDRKIHRGCCRDDYITKIKSIFSVDTIFDKIHKLLLGNFVEVNLSKPFSKSNMIILYEIIKSLKCNSDTSDDLLFVFLYHLGYLSIAEVKHGSLTCLKIPNQEIFFQFAKCLKESYEIKYTFHPEHIENFQLSANSFRSSRMSDELFSKFFKSLNKLIANSTYPSQAQNDFSSVLFILIACRLSFIRSKSFGATKDSYHDFMAINDHDIAIFIHSKMVNLGTKETEKFTIDAHNQLVNNQYYQTLVQKVKDKLKGKVYISISCSLNKKFTIAYSFSLKDDVPLHKPKIIS